MIKEDNSLLRGDASMKAPRILYGSFLIAIFAFQAGAKQDEPFLARVKALEGKTTAARRQAILNILRNLNLEYSKELFQAPSGSGYNIVTTFGQGEGQILVGAHYDVLPWSPGANDNGSGVSVALGLVEKLKDAKMNSTIKVIFFDAEEQGGVGSRAYINSHKGDKIIAYFNLDVCGAGDTIFFGPGYGGQSNPALQAVRRVVKEKNISHAESTPFPPGDDRSFQAAGIPNVSIAIVSKKDAILLTQMMKGEPSEEAPQVLKIIDTPKDNSALVQAEAIERVFEVIYGALLHLDSQSVEAEMPAATERKMELPVR